MTVAPVVAEWHPYEGQHQRRELWSSAEAASLLQELGTGSHGRVLVDFVHPNRSCLTVAAGGTVSALGFQKGLDPPYYASRGDGVAISEDFSYGGDYTDFPPNVYISGEIAAAAVQEFVSSGSRPMCVDWQEV